ncbi:hypothetical protein RHGRI_033158 [Rhododendron griersonianum]|uniref:Protein FAR1-RELATED SEQUENCE n=1 Tax=Rhododendron griersonianum TaxID=479676 RepID=A0AAV6HW39_9ERIC|nr:hypothetical protein RHGRI_033158 [Rhododendron griersonianum]
MSRDMVDVAEEAHDRDGAIVDNLKRDGIVIDGDTDLEPRNGIEFESHESAYSFYQEYAKSMGFTTSIKNSRRSKKSKEFIDAKFACSRYGVTPESDGGSGRRPGVKKTDCKASMHVKKRKDGKWYIHEFIKEHNHELLPALAYHFRIHRNVKLAEKNNIDIVHAVSERTRKMYVEMSRQSAGHAMIVLQICGFSSIPSHYILKRWTKDAKTRQSMVEGTERVQTRVQRYNDLCKRAIELGEEGSLSEEGYNIAFRAVVEALKNCVNVNNVKSAAESSSTALCLRDIEEENQRSLAVKTSKKRTPTKKRKVQAEPGGILVEPQDSLQHMENLSSEGLSLNGYYGAQQNMQGLLQLNLMEPPHDAYYVSPESMPGLGQLSSMASSHGGFFGTQQSMHGLGHLDFRPQTSFSYNLQEDKLDTVSDVNIGHATDVLLVVEEEVNSPTTRNGAKGLGLNAGKNISRSGEGVDEDALGVDTSGKESKSYEPQRGLEFESKEEAYSFYREYARSVGFGITIKASRRSKKSGKFIDVKIACSRFGSKPDSCTAVNSRSCPKTDCKASMHMKRRQDGKWFIFGFVKEHNHEICPSDFYYALSGRGKQPGERSECSSSSFDKYLQRETSCKDFMDRYKLFLHDRSEEEAKADCETHHKSPTLRSLSPFEKQMSTVYTRSIFKKFQVEVLGTDACRVQKTYENEAVVTYQVDDFEEQQSFIVAWNEANLHVSCLCRSFEYRGFLCRHALIVLQMSGVSDIPPRCILRRWTNDANIRLSSSETSSRFSYRVQRFNDLCKRAIKLGEEGSLSQERYNIVIDALQEAMEHCVGVNTSVRSVLEPNMSATQGFISTEEENQSNSFAKASKKKKIHKKRKVQSETEVIASLVQDCNLQMGMLDSGAHIVDNTCVPQQHMPGMGQIHSSSLIHNGYYSNQQGTQGMGQSNSFATRIGHYGPQQSLQGLLQGPLGFRAPTIHGYFNIQDSVHDVEQSVGSRQFHDVRSKRLHDKHLLR